MTVAQGAVYDRGYRPYEGDRGGRNDARLALFRASARRALGWRRPWRQKVISLGLLAIAVIPAVVNVGVRYLTRNTPATDIRFITFREYVGVSNALLLFVAVTAPDIICPDRRQRVLPLIFARPLTGIDYVTAKVGALFAILFAFSFLPQVVLFVGEMLVTEEGALRYVRNNAEVLWQVPVAVAILSFWYAVIGVAVASLTTRRIIAGAVIVGLFLVASITSAILVGSTESRTTTRVGPVSPTATSIDEEGRVIVVVPPPSEQRGFSDPPDAFLVDRPPSAAPLVNLLGLPLIVRDLVFEGHVDHTNRLSGYDNGGALAVGLYLVIVTGASALLVMRYREADA